MRRRIAMGFALVGAVVLAGIAAWYWAAKNVETPDYRVVAADGAIELRDYPPMMAAEVRREGGRWEAVNRGFGPLARYIFAKERSGEKIAMTAPVTQQRTSTTAPSGPTATGSWRVRFIMPSKYSRETLPAPSGADVRLVEVPAERVAAIRFSGVATDPLIAEAQEKLMAWIDSKGLKPVGPPVYAYYNDPFTPGFLRRNEVLVEVEGDAS